jgi:HEAT repeat protein
MLAVLRLQTGDLWSLEFGRPLEPALTLTERLDWIIADYDRRRDELWESPAHLTAPILAQRLEAAEPDAPALLPLIRLLGSLGMLSTLNTENAFPAIDRRLVYHPDPLVQLACIRALGQLVHRGAIERLTSYLRHPVYEFRAAAMIALSRFGDPETVPDLRQATSRNADLRPVYDQCRTVIDAIAAKDIETVVDVLLQTDEYEDLLPWLPVTQRPLMERVAQVLRGPVVRSRALRLLSLGRVRQAKKEMQKILAEEREPKSLRLQAIEGLGFCRSKGATEPLLDVLNHPDPDYQDAAVTALGLIGRARTLDPLLEKWDEREGDLRERLRLAVRRLCVPGTEELMDWLPGHEPLPLQDVVIMEEDFTLSREYRPDLVRVQLDSHLAEARRDAALLIAFLGSAEDAPRLQRMAEQDRGIPANYEAATLGYHRLQRARPASEEQHEPQ